MRCSVCPLDALVGSLYCWPQPIHAAQLVVHIPVSGLQADALVHGPFLGRDGLAALSTVVGRALGGFWCLCFAHDDAWPEQLFSLVPALSLGTSLVCPWGHACIVPWDIHYIRPISDMDWLSPPAAMPVIHSAAGIRAFTGVGVLHAGDVHLHRLASAGTVGAWAGDDDGLVHQRGKIAAVHGRLSGECQGFDGSRGARGDPAEVFSGQQCENCGLVPVGHFQSLLCVGVIELCVTHI